MDRTPEAEVSRDTIQGETVIRVYGSETRNDVRACSYAGFVLAFVWIGCLAGCARDAGNGADVIARVGSEELTRSAAALAIDSLAGPVDEQLRRIVAAWIKDELLYQEARRAGIEGTEEFRRQLDEAQRQLAISLLLKQRIYSDVSKIDEDSLLAYFDRRRSEFVIREDQFKLRIIRFPLREQASAFAARVSQGIEWPTAVSEAIAAYGDSGIAVFDTGRYHSQRSLFWPQLWKVAGTLKLSEISYPVKSPQGYYIIQLTGEARRGGAPQFELVRDEVETRMIVERRQRRYEELLGTLRANTDVEPMVK